MTFAFSKLQRWMCCFILCGLIAGCHNAPPLAESIDPAELALNVERLCGLIHRRLELMEDVARWKWNGKHPISDPEREKQLLADLTRQGSQLDLDPAWTEAFFSAQFAASKRYQEDRFAVWTVEEAGPFEDVPDLRDVQRKRISEMSQELLIELAKLDSAWSHPEATAAIRENISPYDAASPFSATVWELAIAPLQAGPPE